ncbi:YsnF/AvaK domain-containing protein [Saccharibacillus kuerlensis]|uniref:YsnF/AvaK domain-containing protein n=1 Tax=Saccharibacillus kuerlensis TaxID=459527 RepID=A0ABQ2L9W7_9BACL|nr:YsnF/AvaK domain-containing protein [Saccharibacillus kuerlensis]GGO08094.1 hypothetical protein GCM10010969_37220 [Saccharibacillus kuerlensis]
MTDKVVGVFLTDREASEAIEDLKQHGYSQDDISIIAKNHEDAEAISERTGTKAPEGAAGGATAGGILGGVGGLLAGLGALAIPGIGPLLAAGPIATTLAGIAVGATGGGLVGGLIGLGIPEEEAKTYDEHVSSGRLLVIVDAHNQNRDEVERIFRHHYALNHTSLGAEDNMSNLNTAPPRQAQPDTNSAAMIDRNDSEASAQNSRTEAPTAPSVSDDETLQLRAEQLDIEKRQVRTGEVNVRKEIVREEKTITVPVMHEEVVIERRAVDGTSSDEGVGQTETIRIPVSEEQIEINKRNVVTGEVDVTKQTVQGTQRVEDTVRHEEARVERTGSVRAADPDFVPTTDSVSQTDGMPDETSGLPPRSERSRR